MFKMIAAFIILLITIISGLWPFIKKKNSNLSSTANAGDFTIGESFASGVFLGAGLLHMLPDATNAFIKAGYHYPLSFLIAASIFLLLLLLEHISVSLQHHTNSLVSSLVLLTTVMLSIHALLEGTAVGISADFVTTLIIFVAIIAHKGAASFALSINLNKSNLNFQGRFLAFAFFALMTPLGIFAGDWISLGSHQNILLTPIFSSLAAGTFLYIGTLHGLDRASLIKNCCNMREFFIMLLGFIIMAIVAIWT
jgi:zinc transporter ZupT